MTVPPVLEHLLAFNCFKFRHSGWWWLPVKENAIIFIHRLIFCAKFYILFWATITIFEHSITSQSSYWNVYILHFKIFHVLFLSLNWTIYCEHSYCLNWTIYSVNILTAWTEQYSVNIPTAWTEQYSVNIPTAWTEQYSVNNQNAYTEQYSVNIQNAYTEQYSVNTWLVATMHRKVAH
jgi:hypothetical protein